MRKHRHYFELVVAIRLSTFFLVLSTLKLYYCLYEVSPTPDAIENN
ncbi:hypothetical protein T4B_10503 [Trichinella pseudospiralis]|uniref:Uncharacterized protein n=1 Tax=Trichinella pseudospiralis TaxID=6337 RepID=A0A0V1H5D4_TRIPS|nr:hypothetical protein T4B_10503 [Trichinella pseudospiralis]